MHGLIFTQLRKFMAGRLGQAAWSGLIEDAGLAGRTYLPVRHYPDAEITALFQVAAEALGLDRADMLRAFGEAMVPDLMELSGTLLKPEWRTLDVVAEAERTIHRIVKMPDPQAVGVRLRAHRHGAAELTLHYASQRRLCALAHGVIEGLARYFKETVAVTETACMHRGRPECVFVLRRG